MTISSTASTTLVVAEKELGRTTWCRTLAASLPVAAVLLVVAEALYPKNLDNPAKNLATATKELAAAGAHTHQFYVASLLTILGLAVLGVSFRALALLPYRRGALLAGVVAGLGWFTTLCGVVGNAVTNYALAAAAATHPKAAVAARSGSTRTPRR
jgi:hypothetical protein